MRHRRQHRPKLGFSIVQRALQAIFGNLDEAAATSLLINCLAYFGVDIGHFLRRKGTEEKPEPKTHDIDVTK